MSFMYSYLPEMFLGLIIVVNLFSIPHYIRQIFLIFFTCIIVMSWVSIESNTLILSGFTPWEDWFRIFILMFTGLLLFMFLRSSAEQFMFTAIIGLGASMMVLSHHWMELFLWMEMQTLSIFVLVAQRTSSSLSTEAGMKYFVLAAFASGLLLFGIALEYQTWGSLYFSIEAGRLNEAWTFSQSLIMVGVLFKIAAVPFHQWVPDVYEGSSWKTLLILGSLPKFAMLAVLVKLGLSLTWLWLFGLCSIFLGVLGAFQQIKLRRLVAYSSISHSGFMLLGLSLGSGMGYYLASLYMFMYMLTFWLFALCAHVYLNPRYALPLWTSLSLRTPWVTLLIATSLFSLAGVPPLGGFLAKWGILWILVQQQFMLTALMALLGACMGAGYYLWWVKALYFEPVSNFWQWNSLLQPPAITSYQAWLLGWLWFFVISLLLFPQWLMDSLTWASWCMV